MTSHENQIRLTIPACPQCGSKAERIAKVAYYDAQLTWRHGNVFADGDLNDVDELPDSEIHENDESGAVCVMCPLRHEWVTTWTAIEEEDHTP